MISFNATSGGVAPFSLYIFAIKAGVEKHCSSCDSCWPIVFGAHGMSENVGRFEFEAGMPTAAGAGTKMYYLPVEIALAKGDSEAAVSWSYTVYKKAANGSL